MGTEIKTIYDRTELIIGEEGINSLKKAKIIVFGLGGVGGYAVEALCRAGVGSLTLVDYDVVDITNINRQIIALQSTINMFKTEALKDRINAINPEIEVKVIREKVSEENFEKFPLNSEKYDFIIDAIDDVPAKILIGKEAYENNVPIISSMGMGNKLYPEKIQIADIHKTHTCPLAKKVRKELKQQNVKRLMTVFSSEKPQRQPLQNEEKIVPGSISFVPAAAGLIMSGYVVRELINLGKP